uniref:Uncharacterized protein n=1 Tax=Ixodes ricinus TaxID=34613 RepID=A0A6B0UAW4_IXORI
MLGIVLRRFIAFLAAVAVQVCVLWGAAAVILAVHRFITSACALSGASFGLWKLLINLCFCCTSNEDESVTFWDRGGLPKECKYHVANSG